MTKSKEQVIVSKTLFADRYLKIRTIIVVILTTVILFLIPNNKPNFVIAIAIGLLTGILSYLISSFLRVQLNNHISIRLSANDKKINHKEFNPSGYLRDTLIYALDIGFSLNLPIIIASLVNKHRSITEILSNIFFSNILWTILLIIAMLRYGFMFFIYKKRYFPFFAIFLLSVPVSFCLQFFGNIITMSHTMQHGLLIYSELMTVFLATAGAFDYIDKNIQLNEGKTKIVWNKFIAWVAWDFLEIKKQARIIETNERK